AEFVVGAIFQAIDHDVRSTSVMRYISKPLAVGTECEVIAPNVPGRGVAHEVLLSINYKYGPVVLICYKSHMLAVGAEGDLAGPFVVVRLSRAMDGHELTIATLAHCVG